MNRRIDVPLALQQLGEVALADATPILAQGLVLLTLPALAARLLAADHGATTALAALGGIAAALFVVLVSHGTLLRLRGEPLAPANYFRRGIIASPPGFSTALLLGTLGVVAAIVELVAGWPSLIAAGVVLAAVAAGIVVAPAVPLALAERCPPLVALRRAASLTRGRRSEIVVLAVLTALTFGPAALGVHRLGFGASGVGEARLWAVLLFDLIAGSVVATLPAIIYVQLKAA